MKFLRKTIFWIIILVILGGGFYFINIRVEESKRIKETSQRLLPFDIKDILEFWIQKNGNGSSIIRVLRKGEEWWIDDPLKTKGDKKAIEKFLGNIIKARRDAILFKEAEESKLRELGLKEPDLEIGFKTPMGSTTILFGNKGPTHNVAYAMFVNRPEVYRIHSDVKEEADKDLYDLRDKTILSFDPFKVKRFKIEYNGVDGITIEQPVEGKWDVIEPVKGTASMEKVLETLYKLKESEVKAFIEEDPKNLAIYGLKSPRMTVIITEKGDKKQTLSIGSRDRKRRGYYAKTSKGDNVFLIEEDLMHILELNINELIEE